MKKKLLSLLTAGAVLTLSSPIGVMANPVEFMLTDAEGSSQLVNLSDAASTLDAEKYYVTIDENETVQLVTAETVEEGMAVFELKSLGGNKYGNESMQYFARDDEDISFYEYEEVWSDACGVTTSADYVGFELPSYEDVWSNKERSRFYVDNYHWVFGSNQMTQDGEEGVWLSSSVIDATEPLVLYQNGAKRTDLPMHDFNTEDEHSEFTRDEYEALRWKVKALLFEANGEEDYGKFAFSPEYKPLVHGYSLKPFEVTIVDGEFVNAVAPVYNVTIDKEVGEIKQISTPEEKEEFFNNLPKTEVETKVETAKFTLSGYIKDKDGKPVANATVILHSNPRTTTTDENGYWEFKNPEIGEHTLTAYVNGEKIYEAKLTVTENSYNKKVVMNDERYNVETKTIAPETGDVSNMYLYVVLILGALLLMGSGTYLYATKKKQTK